MTIERNRPERGGISLARWIWLFFPDRNACASECRTRRDRLENLSSLSSFARYGSVWGTNIRAVLRTLEPNKKVKTQTRSRGRKALRKKGTSLTLKLHKPHVRVIENEKEALEQLIEQYIFACKEWNSEVFCFPPDFLSREIGKVVGTSVSIFHAFGCH